ncbi:MAG TPA: STAS/SEC14 domain-containing protein [Chthoniobacteraceae bacterium]|nr:STAS/SEC14 domain-containing protein [Chthoniobacteraceae bacterium]
MIEIIPELPDNIVAAKAHGKITAEDYKKTFIPVIEQKLAAHKKIRLLYQLGDDFSGYSLAAVFQDAKVGLAHWNGFDKIAVVTDVHWVADACKFFGAFIPCPVMVFPNAKLDEAKAWIEG